MGRSLSLGWRHWHDHCRDLRIVRLWRRRRLRHGGRIDGTGRDQAEAERRHHDRPCDRNQNAAPPPRALPEARRRRRQKRPHPRSPDGKDGHVPARKKRRLRLDPGEGEPCSRKKRAAFAQDAARDTDEMHASLPPPSRHGEVPRPEAPHHRSPPPRPRLDNRKSFRREDRDHRPPAAPGQHAKRLTEPFGVAAAVDPLIEPVWTFKTQECIAQVKSAGCMMRPGPAAHLPLPRSAPSVFLPAQATGTCASEPEPFMDHKAFSLLSMSFGA